MGQESADLERRHASAEESNGSADSGSTPTLGREDPVESVFRCDRKAAEIERQAVSTAIARLESESSLSMEQRRAVERVAERLVVTFGPMAAQLVAEPTKEKATHPGDGNSS